MGHMDEAIRDQWAAALESGEYEQGKQALVKVTTLNDGEERRYCCLGVLCDLAVKAGVPLDEIVEDGKVWYDSESSVLPARVVAWAGLDGEVADIQASDSCNIKIPLDGDTLPLWTAQHQGRDDYVKQETRWTLAEANDYGGDFAFIAALIRRHL
jgi:hypothetical protein